jgi:flagellin
MERLSSGKRINSAKDDAAGGAVAAKLRADIGSISQAIRNTNDGISLINTYDGAASEIESVLIRMRQLATQAKTGTYTDADMSLASKEYDQLKSEIRRIAQVTTFNRVVVANGSADGTGEVTTFLVFAGADPSKSGNSISFDAGTLDLNKISAVGAYGTFLPSAFSSAAVGGLGTITETTTSTATGASGVWGTGTNSTTTAGNASAALVQVDIALNLLASKRANAGALINRLEHTVSNLLNVNQRLQEAVSGIEDADYAAESANLARGMVLAQAGTAMLAQANQQPQYILPLLK